MRSRTAHILLLLVLAGCAGDVGAARRAQLAALIGQPETELVRSLGVPSRSYEASGRKFLAYDERRIDILPGFGYPYFGGFYGRRYGFYGVGFGAVGPEVVENRCETTFELADGRVQGWALRGNACG